MNVVEHSLKGSKAPKKLKSLKSFSAKEQHDGKYHVERHSGKPGEQPMEHSAENLNAVQQALEDHLGTPNEGEEVAEAQPGMGGAPQSVPPLGQGQPGEGG
jgi:hypothetical protein